MIAWEDWVDIFTHLWGLLVDGWNEFSDKIMSIVSPIWDSITEAWNAVWTAIYDYVVERVGAIADYFVSWTTWFSEQWPKFWNRIKDAWETFWNGFVKWFTGILDSIKNIVAKMGDYIMGIGKAILNAGAEIVKSAYNIGSNIVKGVWDGIIAMRDWFYNQIKGFFSGITNSIKGVLGIHSPSTLFRDQIGRWLPPGIVEGFEDALPTAMKSIESLLYSGIDTISASDIGAGYISQSGFSGTKSGQSSGGSEQTVQTPTGNGSTYNFYSPEPITEAVARREFEKVQRQLAFGF